MPGRWTSAHCRHCNGWIYLSGGYWYHDKSAHEKCDPKDRKSKKAEPDG